MLNILNALGPHEVLQRGHTYPYFKEAKPEAGRDEVFSEVFPFYSGVTKLVGHACVNARTSLPLHHLTDLHTMATNHNNKRITKFSAPNACLCGIDIPRPIPGSHAF